MTKPAIVKQVPISGKGKLGCRRCGGWGYIRHPVPAACPTCDLCNGTGADPDQGPAASNGDQ